MSLEDTKKREKFPLENNNIKMIEKIVTLMAKHFPHKEHQQDLWAELCSIVIANGRSNTCLLKHMPLGISETAGEALKRLKEFLITYKGERNHRGSPVPPVRGSAMEPLYLAARVSSCSLWSMLVRYGVISYLPQQHTIGKPEDIAQHVLHCMTTTWGEEWKRANKPTLMCVLQAGKQAV